MEEDAKMPMANARMLGDSDVLEASNSDGTPSLRPGNPKKVFDRKTTSWLHGWKWEILAISIGISTFVATIGTLLKYDGGPIPTLPGAATLNFVASILATISKAMVSFAVASAINQCRWIRYAGKQPQRLDELQMFDDASRGPSGSIQLLLSTRLQSWAAIGAFLAIASLGYDPFIQQLIRYEQRLVYNSDAQAVVKQALTFSDSNPCQYALSDEWKDAVHAALPDSASGFDVPPICPSKNCTWQPYDTLQFCSTCLNITSWALKRSSCSTVYPYGYEGAWSTSSTSCRYSLPSPLGNFSGSGSDEYGNNYGSSILFSNAVGGQFAQYEYSPSDEFATFPIPNHLAGGEAAALLGADIWNASLAVIGTLRMDIDSGFGGTNESNVKDAYLCSVRLCLRHLNTSMVDSVAQSTMLSSREMSQIEGDTLTFVSSNSTAEGRGQATKITLAKDTVRNLAAALGSYFVGSLSAAQLLEGCPKVGADGTNSTGSPDILASLSQTKDFSGMIDRVTQSMTKKIMQDSNTTNLGKVGTMQTFVTIRWAWIALPTIIISTAAAFLALVIVQTERQQVVLWKGSNLPLIFSSRIDDPLQKQSGITLKEMKTIARLTNVHLEKTANGGWLLSNL